MTDPAIAELSATLWPKIDRIMSALAVLYGTPPPAPVTPQLSQDQIAGIRKLWRDLGEAWIIAHFEFHGTDPKDQA